MTPDTIQKLEQAFLMGCTDREACLFADISQQTLYNYCEKNPEFIERKERLKDNPVMRARKVVLDAIVDEKSLVAAQELLKRKEGSKVALTGADGGPIVTQVVRKIVRTGD
jgi:hypothetical protein